MPPALTLTFVLAFMCFALASPSDSAENEAVSNLHVPTAKL